MPGLEGTPDEAKYESGRYFIQLYHDDHIQS
jgi:hypothetical protein